jgi:hypothetical protein
VSSRREYKARQGKLPGRLLVQGQAGCLPAVRLLHFQVVLLGRGEKDARGSRGLVVQGERRSRAAASHEPLDSFRGWRLGAEVEKSTLEGPAKHDGRWRKR